MKLIKFCFLTIFLLAAAAHAGEKNIWDQKLPFEAATIKYTVDGMEKGTETLYLADFGQRSAKYRTTSMKMMGMTMDTKTLEIMDPDWVYQYDLAEGTGIKITNPKKYMKMEYDKLSSSEKKQVQKNAEKLSVNFMQGGGGKVEEKVTKMFGYDVDRVNVMGMDSYLIHNTPIILKSSGNVMGMTFDMAATDFIKGAVDQKHFAHPAGITAVMDEQAENFTRTIAKNTIDWLKDPDAENKSPKMAFPDMMGGQQGNPSAPSSQPDAQEAEQAQKMMESIMKGLLNNQ